MIPTMTQASSHPRGSVLPAVLIFLALVGVVAVMSVNPEQTYAAKEIHAPDSPPPNLYATVQVMRITNKWQIAHLDLKVYANDSAVKDMVISCEFRGGSGTAISSRLETIHEIVQAGKDRTFKDVGFGFIPQGAKDIRCELVRATPAYPTVKTAAVQEWTTHPTNPDMFCTKVGGAPSCRLR
jgi:hypothetical protein